MQIYSLLKPMDSIFDNTYQPKAGLKRNSLPETPLAGGMQQGRVAGPFAKMRWMEKWHIL
jgi:hypothetical protein